MCAGASKKKKQKNMQKDGKWKSESLPRHTSGQPENRNLRLQMCYIYTQLTLKETAGGGGYEECERRNAVAEGLAQSEYSRKVSTKHMKSSEKKVGMERKFFCCVFK